MSTLPFQVTASLGRKLVPVRVNRRCVRVAAEPAVRVVAEPLIPEFHACVAVSQVF
jgi:hypothetical protein